MDFGSSSPLILATSEINKGIAKSSYRTNSHSTSSGF